MSDRSYASAEAAGPRVDLTVWGPFRTVSLPPDEARWLARDLTYAADKVEAPEAVNGPGLSIVIGAQGPEFRVHRG